VSHRTAYLSQSRNATTVGAMLRLLTTDLRTPMSFLKMNAGVLQSKPPVPAGSDQTSSRAYLKTRCVGEFESENAACIHSGAIGFWKSLQRNSAALAHGLLFI